MSIRLKNLFSGLAVQQSIFSARLMYLFILIAYPIIGSIYKLVLVDVQDPIWIRVVFPLAILVVFILSFKSEIVKRSISDISLILYYLMTFHVQYLISVNNHQPEYVVGFIIVLMSAGMILSDLRSLLMYTITIIICFFLGDFGPPQPHHLNQILETTMIITALSVSGVIILARMHLMSRISLSKQIVDSVDALILVFNKENELIFSNNKTILSTGISDNDILSEEVLEHLESETKESIQFVNSIKSNQVNKWFKWNFSNAEKGMKVLIGQEITDLKQKENDLLRLSGKIQKYADRIDTLHKLDNSIIASKTYEDSVEKALGFLHDLVPESSCLCLISFNKQSAVMDAVLKTGQNVEFIDRKLPSGFLPDKASLHSDYLYVEDLKKKPDLSLFEKEIIEEGMNSLVIFPIKAESTLIASINIGFSSSASLTKPKLEELKDISQEIGFFVRQIKLKSDIQEKNQSLIKKNKALLSANEELRRFAYVASHDLKAPLRAVNSLARFIYEDHKEELSDQGKDQLALLRNRVNRMDTLINGILEYSRVGRIVEVSREIDTKQLAQSIVEALLPKKEMKIEIGDLPIINCEPTRLEQVFQNLITNAIKFKKGPDAFVKIDYDLLDNEILFYVEDNGIGIDPKYSNQIFSLFHTLKNDKNEDSTGIGLSIVKKCVELMEGRIWVESNPGEGSRFSFALPISCLVSGFEKSKSA